VRSQSVKLWADDLVLAHDHYTVVAGEVHRRIALSDPGIDDFRNELLWSPVSPKLIEVEVELLDEQESMLRAATLLIAIDRPRSERWCLWLTRPST
jgi:hypothetical protein